MRCAIVAGTVVPADQPEAFLQLHREMQVGYGAS
jgi:hypothetical protein